MNGGDLSSFESSLGDVFRKMGLPDPVLMSQLIAEWDELAGSPWVGRSRPVVIKGRTLVVEASAPSMVAFLRYGASQLLTTLSERFGDGVVDQVEVIPPSRN
jgi:Dna[CI] antecedent, DciA